MSIYLLASGHISMSHFYLTWMTEISKKERMGLEPTDLRTTRPNAMRSAAVTCWTIMEKLMNSFVNFASMTNYLLTYITRLNFRFFAV